MTKRTNKPIDVFKHINMHEGNKDVCWEYTGYVDKRSGRPYITINGKRHLAYRVVYALVYGSQATCDGEVPSNADEGVVSDKGPLLDSDIVRHDCDNGICCNPHHLRRGSHQDNMDDMKERDRHGLPAHVVVAIRRLIDNGRTQKEIAEVYGISREAVSAIATGRNKSHVTNSE